MRGHNAIVKLLLDTGKVNVDARDSWYNRTPLSWAAVKGHEAIVKLLLDARGTSFDQGRSNTALVGCREMA
jgi:ankyrin repeat protein